LLLKVSGCHGLLVMATPFPHVHTTAESILQKLASILHNDNFFRKSGCDCKKLVKQFPDYF